jgi:hypothetical protein
VCVCVWMKTKSKMSNFDSLTTRLISREDFVEALLNRKLTPIARQQCAKYPGEVRNEISDGTQFRFLH